MRPNRVYKTHCKNLLSFQSDATEINELAIR